jgi:hypothetical protein
MGEGWGIADSGFRIQDWGRECGSKIQNSGLGKKGGFRIQNSRFARRGRNFDLESRILNLEFPILNPEF